MLKDILEEFLRFKDAGWPMVVVLVGAVIGLRELVRYLNERRENRERERYRQPVEPPAKEEPLPDFFKAYLAQYGGKNKPREEIRLIWRIVAGSAILVIIAVLIAIGIHGSAPKQDSVVATQPPIDTPVATQAVTTPSAPPIDTVHLFCDFIEGPWQVECKHPKLSTQYRFHCINYFKIAVSTENELGSSHALDLNCISDNYYTYARETLEGDTTILTLRRFGKKMRGHLLVKYPHLIPGAQDPLYNFDLLLTKLSN